MHRLYGMAAGILLFVMGAAAQDPGADKVKIELQKMVATSKILSTNGGVMGRTVKGAPYSGQEVNENSQMLADGPRIHNEARTKVYRHSEGRARREDGDLVTICDPVANVSYWLNPKNMTAEKLPMPPAMFEKTRVSAGAIAGTASARGSSSGTVSVKDGIVTYTKDGKVQTFPMPASGEWVSDDGKTRVSHVVTGTGDTFHASTGHIVTEGQVTITGKDGKPVTMPLPPDAQSTFERRVIVTPPGEIGMAIAGGDFGAGTLRMEKANIKTDELGDQVIEGVKGHGTRITSTIPE